MRTYVMTTGAIFGLLVVAHVWRVVVERSLVTDPFFIIVTLIAAFLALWAWRLVRRSQSS